MKISNQVPVRAYLVLLAVILVLTIAACGKQESSPASQDTPTQVPNTPTTSPLATVVPQASEVSPLATSASPLPTGVSNPNLPKPSEGLATVAGELYSFVFHKPIPGTVFYFTPAQGENQDEPPIAFLGAREEYGDVPGLSDEDGRFVIQDIPPGKYYLAVWAPYSWILAVEEEGSRIPKLFVIGENQQLDLGRLLFDWPNG